jgi:hypothetical protein
MRFLRISILVLAFFSASNTLVSQHLLEFNGGLPFAYGHRAFGRSYNLEMAYYYVPKEKSGFGLGLRYLQSDLSEGGVLLTYDRSSLAFFAGYNYRFGLNPRLSLAPEIRLGYAFTEGSLNQYWDFTHSDSDVMVGINSELSYRLTEKFEALLDIGFSHVFSELALPNKLIIPAVFIKGPNHTATFFNFNLGVRYDLSSPKKRK